jgi:hypothetical protein
MTTLTQNLCSIDKIVKDIVYCYTTECKTNFVYLVPFCTGQCYGSWDYTYAYTDSYSSLNRGPPYSSTTWNFEGNYNSPSFDLCDNDSVKYVSSGFLPLVLFSKESGEAYETIQPNGEINVTNVLMNGCMHVYALGEGTMIITSGTKDVFSLHLGKGPITLQPSITTTGAIVVKHLTVRT